MSSVDRSAPKTPSITKESRIYDTLGSVQEGIRMAKRINDIIKEEEKRMAERPKETKKQTPIVTAEDIKKDMQDDEREIC